MTPMASPQPMAHKPAIMLETEICDDNLYFPSTPPLSTCGSAISSPNNSCELLQTPMNPMFSGLDGFDGLDGFKETLEVPENLAVDWNSCGSPPMTPETLSFRPKPCVAARCKGLAGLDTIPGGVVCWWWRLQGKRGGADLDFCDPRNLTVAAAPNTSNPTLAPEYSAFTLGDELRGEVSAKAPTSAPSHQTFDFNPAIPHGLPAFEDLSDLESEDDFVNGLVNLGDAHSAEVRRPRACTGSSVVSLGHASFIGEEFNFDEAEISTPACLPSPSSSCADNDCHQNKRRKVIKQEPRNSTPMMNSAAGSSQATSSEQRSNSQAPASEANSSSDSETPSAPLPAPVNRRGRKQSLTEDPSKTMMGHPEDYHTLGKVLFQCAAEIPGSASELSSEDDNSKKKRKRSD
ncbi:zinc finger protein msn2 4 [Colletotrichum tofieldiae]|nr:zinc finger protein msn2 4 [Colletotrichum tofieldiae]